MAEKRGSCFSRLLKISLVLLILLIALAVAAFLLALGVPVTYPAPQFDARDTSTVANIITRLARSLVDKEGRVVETAVLKLSQDEVQTLLNAAVRSSNDGKTEDLPYTAVWNDGRLHVHFSQPLTSGKAANLAVEVAPVVDKGDLTLIPGGGSVGRLPLPGFALGFAAGKLAQMAMKNDSIRTMLSAFTRIEPGEDGMLVLMFDPRDVNTVVRILRSAGKDPSAPDEDEDEDEEYDDGDEPEEEESEDSL